MKDSIIEVANIEQAILENLTFPDVAMNVSRKTASYVQSYSNAYNATNVENELRSARNTAQTQIIETVFGQGALKKIARKHHKFLGLEGEDLQMGDLDFE